MCYDWCFSFLLRLSLFHFKFLISCSFCHRASIDQSNQHMHYGGIQTKTSQLHYMKGWYGFLCLGVRFDVFTHFESLVAHLLYYIEAVKQLFNFLHASKGKQKVDVNKRRDRMKLKKKCVTNIEAQFPLAIINTAGLAHMTSHIVYFVRWTFGQ